MVMVMIVVMVILMVMIVIVVILMRMFMVMVMPVRFQRLRLVQQLAFAGDHVHGAQIRHRRTGFRDSGENGVHPVVPLAADVQNEGRVGDGRDVGEGAFKIVALGAGRKQHDDRIRIRLAGEVIEGEIGGDDGIFRVPRRFPTAGQTEEDSAGKKQTDNTNCMFIHGYTLSSTMAHSPTARPTSLRGVARSCRNRSEITTEQSSTPPFVMA